MASQTDRSGDSQINVTSAPITEDERAVTREREEALRRPFPWLAGGGIVVLVGLAVVAAVTMGPAYAIPVGLIAVVAAVFVGMQRGAAAAKTRSYEGSSGTAREQAPADADDPIPDLGYDEHSQLGSTAELSDEESQSHADMESSSGQ